MNFKRIFYDNKKIIISVLTLIFIMIVLAPIFINFVLMSWKSNVTFGDSSDWLGWWGTMISSIVGGFISGGLTLAGVILTIKYQERNSFLKSYSEKRTKLDELLSEVIEARRVIEPNMIECDVINLTKYLDSKLHHFSTLLRIASDIDYQLYTEVRFRYVMNLEVLSSQLRRVQDTQKTFTNDKIIELLQISDIKKQLDDLISKVMSEQELLNREYKRLNK